MDEHDRNKVLAIADYYGEKDIDEILNDLDNYNLYEDINSEKDWGDYILENYFEIESYSLKNLLCYIDTERLGRDDLINLDGGLTEYGLIQRM